MNSSMTVWDHEHDPADNGTSMLYWRGYSDQRAGISIPLHLEQNADRLRTRYIEFIHDLGEYRIAGKSVVDHLALEDGFSFWWMTQIAEKSPFKSPRIFDCLRLLALEEILRAQKPARLTLDSTDRNLKRAMSTLCSNLQIEFVWHARRATSSTKTPRRVYQAAPYFVQGFVSLRHIARRWILRRISKPSWFEGDRSVFLCTYFFNMDTALAERGEFQPRQWEGLPALIAKKDIGANWLHLFLPSPSIPNPSAAVQWIQRFSCNQRQQGLHALVETYLSWNVVLRAIALWVKLNLVDWRLRDIKAAFYPKNSAAWLWPLLSHDWHASLAGTVAVNNCFWVELFEVILKHMPKQNSGFYIWENQGWECAFLRSWQRHGHGRIIGVPHTTIAYWHLNNFDAARVFTMAAKNRKPLPEKLAVNGQMARDLFLATGYPAEQLIEVEALRFQYLNTLVGTRQSDSSAATPLKRILLLGDFTQARTLKMLTCMKAALRLVNINYALTLKPHPVCPFKRGEFAGLEFELTSASLTDIVANFDVAFSSNTTSAGLDALIAGLAVIIFLDEDEFNLSPLRGVSNTQFVATPRELADALQTVVRKDLPPAASEFFCLDPALRRWDRLLSSST